MKTLLLLTAFFFTSLVYSQNWEPRMVQYASSGVNTDQTSTVLDYDADGTPDILYGNDYRKELLLLRNNEISTLQLEVLTDSLYGVAFLHALNYNNDGKDDFLIAATTTTGGAIWLCINQGNSVFEWHYVSSYPYEGIQKMVTDDFDNDGDLDFMFDDFANSNVIWRVTNDGNEQFTLDYIEYTGQPTLLYGMADLDDDGDQDLITSYYSFTELSFVLVCQENIGGYDFTAHESFNLSGGGHATLGQFAGDALPDFVYTPQFGTEDVIIYENTGNFTFEDSGIATNLTSYTSVGPTVDYDNDGDDDFLSFENPGNFVMKQNANGTFTGQPLNVDSNGPFSAYLDFNADGEKDLITKSIEICYRTNTYDYDLTHSTYLATSNNLSVANLDGNTNPDIITGGPGGQISIALQRFDERMEYTKNIFLTGANIDYSTPIKQQIPFDKEGDGDIDILCNISTYIYWLINDGNGNFTQQTMASNLNGYNMWIGYLDNDNFHDILLYSDQIKRWEWNGNAYTSTNFGFDTSSSYWVMDADNDNDNDIVYLYYGFPDSELRYFKNNNGNFVTQTIAILDDVIEANYINIGMDMPVQVIDFDNDGDHDFLWGETSPQYIAWCRNDGDLTFTFSVITEDIESLNAFTAGDIDNDGDNDIVLSHTNDAVMLTLVNDGSLTFTSTDIDEIVSNPKQIVLSDMENDNDVDIVFASQYDRRIEWLKNPINSCARSYSSETATICPGDSIAFMDEYIENAGLYSDTLTSFSGCDSVHVFELSLYPVQTISITQNANTLTATSSFSDYQWYFNGNLLADENTNSIDAADYGTGNYSVTATGDNQCNIASTSYSVNSIVSVSENAGYDVQLYPNPFNDGVFITAGNTIIDEIKILDITGRIIHSSKVNLNKNSTFYCDLNTLAAGKYMIQCTDVYGKQNTTSIYKK